MKIEALDTLFTHLEVQLATPQNELRRLFHGRGQCFEGLEQLTVDWLQGQVLVSLGVKQGVSSPCRCYHEKRDISTVVHGPW